MSHSSHHLVADDKKGPNRVRAVLTNTIRLFVLKKIIRQLLVKMLDRIPIDIVVDSADKNSLGRAHHHQYGEQAHDEQENA